VGFRIRFSAETDERSTTVMIAPSIGRHRAVITCPVDAAPPKRVGKPRDLKCGSCGLCLTSREPIVFKLHINGCSAQTMAAPGSDSANGQRRVVGAASQA
jgi:hypothetical protein